MPCQVCNSETISILDLKGQPICNKNLKSKEEFATEKKYPLELVFCEECNLVQLSEVLPREIVFSQNDFNYLSSSSKSVAEYYKALAEKHLKKFNPQSVLEIAGNDGAYLKHFIGKAKILNVEPARQAANISRNLGIPTCMGYFEDAYSQVKFKPDLICAFDVLAHAERLDEIMKGIVSLMGDKTILVAQFHDLEAMLEKNEWDTIYLEHIRYFSLASFQSLLNKYGLGILDFQRTDFYGGSQIVYAIKGKARLRFKKTTLPELERFRTRVREDVETLRDYLLEQKSLGKRIVGIGCPMKSTTLLNAANIGPEILDYLTEVNPLKIGTFSPGVHLEVKPEETIFKEPQPELAICLSWNMLDPITKNLRAKGFKGEIISPHLEKKEILV